MCSAPKPPKVQEVAAPPAPGAPAASINQSGPQSPDKYEGNPVMANRKGRSSLRITRKSSGVNLPTR